MLAPIKQSPSYKAMTMTQYRLYYDSYATQWIKKNHRQDCQWLFLFCCFCWLFVRDDILIIKIPSVSHPFFDIPKNEKKSSNNKTESINKGKKNVHTIGKYRNSNKNIPIFEASFEDFLWCFFYFFGFSGCGLWDFFPFIFERFGMCFDFFGKVSCFWMKFVGQWMIVVGRHIIQKK